ncbi:hypothetical protein Taro_047053 [Colocasia esculenta]|uniref:Uncharacterized protein n=1 Tax=Colocasia esculenta TaxID=4460 RepID=A0A843X697_COLES|nr:hypothetical protein [Colocasia esculenta]
MRTSGSLVGVREVGSLQTSIADEWVNTDFVLVVSTHPLLVSTQSCKPSFQEEGQGNQGESLERRLLCKAREQIQLKRRRRRRISGISDAIQAEHRQLRRISIDFHQGSSIEVSARFGVVVLRLFLESSCSRVFGVVVLQCELYSRF